MNLTNDGLCARIFVLSSHGFTEIEIVVAKNSFSFIGILSIDFFVGADRHLIGNLSIFDCYKYVNSLVQEKKVPRLSPQSSLKSGHLANARLQSDRLLQPYFRCWACTRSVGARELQPKLNIDLLII